MASRALPRLITDLADLLLPVGCAGCGAPGPAPCPRCTADLLALHPFPVSVPAPIGVPLIAAGAFEGPLRRMLIAHKERGRRGLSGSLGALLAEAALTACEASASSYEGDDASCVTSRWVLVPAPSRRSAVRQRGDDTVASLARVAAATLTQAGLVSTSARWLRHRRPVRDQAGLSADARGRNVAGALGLAKIPDLGPGDRVIVVDDITTTGATMAESVSVLRHHGVNVVAAAAVAATQRRTEVPTRRVERLIVDHGGRLGLVPSRVRH